MQNDTIFYSALSGFSDAEGFVGLRKDSGKMYAEYAISNMNRQLMRDFEQGLNSREHNARLYAVRAEKIQWQLEVNGRYALTLLPDIGFRHREKIAGRQIALAYHRSPFHIAGPVYMAHRQAIKVERSALEAIAARRYFLRDERRKRKSEIFKQRVESSSELFSKDLSMQKVADTLGCSIRTAYRRKERLREVEKGRDSTN